MHPFAYLMIVTFLATLVVLFSGIIQMGKAKGKASKSNKLMLLRVALSVFLLLQIIVYIAFIKP